MGNLAWAVKEVKKTGASTKKGTNVDLKATCGIEGPARAGRMAGDTADEAELVTVTGWGKPSDNAGGISPVLRMVSDLPCISNKECNDFYGIVGDGIVCIDTTGGKGSCNG